MLDVKKLFKLMDEKGVKNAHELAKLTKVPYTTITYMLKGNDMYVSSLIELAHFFNIPIDDLINKYYGFTVFTENGEKECPTSNVYEATMSSMM